MAVFYGLLPIAGAFFSRYRWSLFRKRFDDLRLAPLLDYSQYRQLGNDKERPDVFRFTGEIESITDGHTLWVRGEDLTVPVSLIKTKCWLLPVNEGEGVPEAPEKLNWNRVSTLSEGAKVFIGGFLKIQDNRLNFVSTNEKPLMVIFYNCPDTALTDGIIRAARTRNEYWNNFTPVPLVTGALILIYIAASFLNRPAFSLTVITALAAIFVPVYPVFPPGLLLTVLYRRLSWQARRYRAYWDLVRLPLSYLTSGSNSCILGTGEKYGSVEYKSLHAPPEEIPYLIPEITEERKKSQWRFFGVLNENSQLPQKPKDPFVSFGILPDSPKRLVRRYAIKASSLEILAWFALLLGITINVIFIFLILFVFGVVSF